MANTLGILKRIIHDRRKYFHPFLLLGGIGLTIIPLEIYVLKLFRKLIDSGLLSRNWDAIKSILFVLIILLMLRSLIQYITTLFTEKIRLRITQEFQNDLFSHLLHLPMRFFTKEPTGQLMSRILDDTGKLSSILSKLFGSALQDPIKIFVLLGFLAYINIRLCFLMTILTFISFLIIHWMGKRLRFVSKEIQTKNAAIYTFIEQSFYNIELVKSKITEKKTATDFSHLVNAFIQLSIKALKISLIPLPLIQFLTCITIGIIVTYGGLLISKNQITTGTLGLFLGASFFLINTFFSLGKTYGSLRRDIARMEILYEIMDTHPEQFLKGLNDKISLPIQSIDFQNVTFGYDPLMPVLKGVSFHIQRGDVLGITGQSGSGKTTIIRLLAGFYNPDSGEIRINNQSIPRYGLEDLRASLGIVFQENLILNATFKDNIAYGDKDIPMEKIIWAAKISHAHDFIKTFPDQYETGIGESGKRLSGGERQRLAIARALITDPEILVLDEGSSFLEVEQEEIILKKIKEIRKEKITLIISHRLSAIRLVERILILDNGRIIETNFQSLSDE